MTFFVSPKHMFIPLTQIAFYDPLLLLNTYFLKGLVPHVSVAVLVFSLDHPTAYTKWNILFISHLRTWWCLLGFTAVHCCLPVSIALQDHVPAIFRKNLCPLLVSGHPSTPHIISLVISTFMSMYQVVTFLDSCDLKQLVNQPTHLLNICSIVLLHQAVHTPNKVQYRRYHHINMCNFHSDFKNTSFVKSPANAVADPYEQYVHDLVDVLDKHAPLISRLKKKDSADWVSDSY